jgi:hypothetical protein
MRGPGQLAGAPVAQLVVAGVPQPHRRPVQAKIK